MHRRRALVIPRTPGSQFYPNGKTRGGKFLLLPSNDVGLVILLTQAHDKKARKKTRRHSHLNKMIRVPPNGEDEKVGNKACNFSHQTTSTIEPPHQSVRVESSDIATLRKTDTRQLPRQTKPSPGPDVLPRAGLREATGPQSPNRSDQRATNTHA